MWLEIAITVGLLYATIMQMLTYRSNQEVKRLLTRIKTELYMQGMYEGYSLGREGISNLVLEDILDERLHAYGLLSRS